MTMMHNARVDFSRRKGVPLFKKFALFNSGIAPLTNYRRDMYTLDGIYIDSLRVDLFFGGSSRITFGDAVLDFSDTVSGTAENLQYDFTALDEWMRLLNAHGIIPYMSWCYIPKPLQIGGDWRVGPADMDAWRRLYSDYAQHCKDIGIQVYHEIYNEPDMNGAFFKGTWEEYMNLYRYGAKGILDANPEAVVGGPSTAIIERQDGIDDFLKMVKEENLPLDFFSFHSYPQDGTHTEKGHMYRTKMANEALSKDARFDTTELHMNELNMIPVPWVVGGDLDSSLCAVLLLQSFKELLEETNLTLVHWAQWLSSTVDGLGMVEKDGKIKSSLHAYRMYGEMPLARVAADTDGSVEIMASHDGNRACVMMWNVENQPQKVRLSLENMPFDEGKIEIYRLDDKLYPYPEVSAFDIKPEQAIESAILEDKILELTVGNYGFAFIRITNTLEAAEDKLPDIEVVRKHHYYPRRGKSNYAEFNHPDWSFWLGMGEEDSARATVGVGVQGLQGSYDCALTLTGEPDEKTGYLGARIDYRVNGQFVKAVEFKCIGAKSREEIMPWGTKKNSDETVVVRNGAAKPWALEFGKYAPEGWTGEAILTFDMQNTGKGTEAVFTIR